MKVILMNNFQMHNNNRQWTENQEELKQQTAVMINECPWKVMKVMKGKLEQKKQESDEKQTKCTWQWN